jgi:AraC-like DNA-binding protein
VGAISATMASSDVDVAEQLLRAVYPIASFADTRRPFAFSQRIAGDERAVLAHFELSALSEVEVDFSGMIGIGRLIRGQYAARSNGDALETSRPFLFRPGIGRSRSDDLELVMANLDERALSRFAAERSGLERAQLRFHGGAPRTPALAAAWDRTLRHAEQSLLSADLVGNDLVRTALVDLLFAAALTAFPIEVVGRATAAGGGVLPSSIRRATAYIDEHLAEPVSISAVADAARLSTRGLHDAFRRTLDRTPMEYLREARLTAVREDLVAATPAETTVAAVATRWGFHHLGRFAAAYRARFGEEPRRTLHR